MGIFLLFVALVAFVLFFHGIGLWYLGFLPFLFFLILLGYYTSVISVKFKDGKIIEKYGVMIARTIILLGLGGVLHFLGVNTQSIAVGIFGLNALLWIGSFAFEYQDGKSSFQLGYILAIVFLLVNALFQLSGPEFLDLFTALWAGTLGIVAFIVFIVGIFKTIESAEQYKLFVLSIGMIILFVFQNIQDPFTALFVNSIIMTVVFATIWKLLQNKPITENQKKDISLRRVLAGERITTSQKQFRPPFWDMVYNFLDQTPKWSKNALEITNLLIVLALIISFVKNIGGGIESLQQILFWITIISFTGNVLVLKKLGYTSNFQRLIVFGIINFAIYASLYAIFGPNFDKLALRGIIWNTFSSFLIFSVPKFSFSQVLEKRDYIFWIVNILIAMLVNIILLAKSEIQGNLVFSLIFVYLGFQGMLLFYAFKHTKKFSEKTISMEELDKLLEELD